MVETQPDGHRLTITREWGRLWVGCKHGVPKSGIDPVRICMDCFRAAILAEQDRCVRKMEEYIEEERGGFISAFGVACAMRKD